MAGEGAAAARDRSRVGIGRYEIELVTLVAGVVVLLLVLWWTSGILLLVFASVMLAILVRALAALIRRVAPIGDRIAVLLSMAALALVVVGFVILLGSELIDQGRALFDRGPELMRNVGDRLGIQNLDQLVERRLQDFIGEGALIRSTAGYSLGIAGALASLVLVIFGAVYFALEPGLYRRGIGLLVPKRLRPEADRVMLDVGEAVKLWLAGQLLAMLIVGVLTTLGLWALGVESAIALGFLSGMLDFVPFVGPVVAAVPAILVGLGDGASQALWIAALYVAVQQVEASLITPLVQRRTMELPPALTIFTVVAFSALFGPVGTLLAAPLTAAAYVAVGRLWVKDVIGQDVTLPTEEPS